VKEKKHGGAKEPDRVGWGSGQRKRSIGGGGGAAGDIEKQNFQEKGEKLRGGNRQSQIVAPKGSKGNRKANARKKKGGEGPCLWKKKNSGKECGDPPSLG